MVSFGPCSILSLQDNVPPLYHPQQSRGMRMLEGWREGRGGGSLWTKYCLLCTLCGSAATLLAAIFVVVAALFRHYTTSIHYFESVPTFLPAILLSICGVSTMAFSCKRNRKIVLLRITACWSLLSAALSSVITITTSLIHMNRLQTLKECTYHPPHCSCYSHVFPMSTPPDMGVMYVFENTPDCEVIHGVLYSCLRAVFAISVVAVLLSIFLCMLLYQLIGHERKKAYWSRIRRVNSDWSNDFLAFSRPPMPPRVEGHLPIAWGPPPPYSQVADEPPFFSAPTPHPFSPTITCLGPIDPIPIFNQQHYSIGCGNRMLGVGVAQSIRSISSSHSSLDQHAIIHQLHSSRGGCDSSGSVFEQDSLEEDLVLCGEEVGGGNKLLSLPCSPLIRRGIRIITSRRHSHQQLHHLLEEEGISCPPPLFGSSLPSTPKRRGLWGRSKKFALEQQE